MPYKDSFQHIKSKHEGIKYPSNLVKLYYASLC